MLLLINKDIEKNMVIECVTLETNHLFYGNPIAEQSKLRYRSIIERQGWEVPQFKDMEYDSYDNPATIYLVWRNDEGLCQGVSRLYPTDRPFMLSEAFPYMVDDIKKISQYDIWEGSRFCIDKNAPLNIRKQIANEIIQAYLECGLNAGIQKIVGVMFPVYWKNLFENNGWKPNWIGEATKSSEGKTIRAAELEVSEEVLEKVKEHTGIKRSIVTYGTFDKRELDTINRATKKQVAV